MIVTGSPCARPTAREIVTFGGGGGGAFGSNVIGTLTRSNRSPSSATTLQPPGTVTQSIGPVLKSTKLRRTVNPPSTTPCASATRNVPGPHPAPSSDGPVDVEMHSVTITESPGEYPVPCTVTPSRGPRFVLGVTVTTGGVGSGALGSNVIGTSTWSSGSPSSTTTTQPSGAARQSMRPASKSGMNRRAEKSVTTAPVLVLVACANPAHAPRSVGPVPRTHSNTSTLWPAS